MLLKDFLIKHKITSEQFAKQMGVSYSTVQKWRLKKTNPQFRMPRPAMLVKIQKATKGKVGPADWYNCKE